MSWEYRIVEYADGISFGLHEVYYEDGEPMRMEQEPACFAGESAEEVREELLLAHTDAVRRPVFKEPDDW